MSLILTCPECATRYVARAEGFEPPGRNVRCSQCDHLWFQEVAEPESYETLYELYEGEEAGPAEDTFAPEPVRNSPPPPPPRVSRSASVPGLSDVPDLSDARGLSDVRVPYDNPSHGERGSRLVSGLIGVFATIAVLGSLVAGGWYFRPAITQLIPATGALYALLPGGNAVSEFGFQNTTYSRVNEEGALVLIVSGEVINTSDEVVPVPAIRAVLRDNDKRDVDEWIFTPRGDDMEPGEARYFESRRLDPPGSAYRLHLLVVEDSR